LIPYRSLFVIDNFDANVVAFLHVVVFLVLMCTVSGVMVVVLSPFAYCIAGSVDSNLVMVGTQEVIYVPGL